MGKILLGAGLRVWLLSLTATSPLLLLPPTAPPVPSQGRADLEDGIPQGELSPLSAVRMAFPTLPTTAPMPAALRQDPRKWRGSDKEIKT